MQMITESWQGHLGGTEIHFGGSDMLGFGSGYVLDQLGGSGLEISVRPSWTLGLGHIWVEIVVEGIGIVSLST